MSRFIYVFSMIVFKDKDAPLNVAFENPATVKQIIEGVADVSEKFNTNEMRISLGIELAGMHIPSEWDAVLDAAMMNNGWASFQRTSSNGTALFSVQRLSIN